MCHQYPQNLPRRQLTEDIVACVIHCYNTHAIPPEDDLSGYVLRRAGERIHPARRYATMSSSGGKELTPPYHRHDLRTSLARPSTPAGRESAYALVSSMGPFQSLRHKTIFPSSSLRFLVSSTPKLLASPPGTPQCPPSSPNGWRRSALSVTGVMCHVRPPSDTHTPKRPYSNKWHFSPSRRISSLRLV